jgi:hypothetical protein
MPTKVETALKEGALRTVVVNFRKLAKGSACKWHEMEKYRHYSFNAPCTSRIK